MIPQQRTRHRAKRRDRRGVSLLEVLVSSFILLFGLVGVASMFPVGRLYTQQSNRYDRAAAVGQAAFNEIQTRGFLNPEYWYFGDGTTKVKGTDDPLRAYLFDPIGVSRLGGISFPNGVGTLPRISVPDKDSNVMSPEVADYVCISRDDLVVEFPENPDLPSENKRDSSNAARQFEGNFSWMFTVVPQGGTDSEPERFLVSVIVFDRRPYSALNSVDIGKTEASLTVESFPSGYGGGPAQLSGAADVLEAIDEGEWIMLSGTVDGRPRHSWYRVVNAGNVTGTTAWFTLQGPDWVPPPPPDPPSPPTTASFADGVVAVYEKIMPRVALD